MRAAGANDREMIHLSGPPPPQAARTTQWSGNRSPAKAVSRPRFAPPSAWKMQKPAFFSAKVPLISQPLDDSTEKDMDLRIDEEKNIAYIKLSGLLSKKVILSAFDLTVSDKRYKNGMGRLWDFRDAELSSLDSETITEMAQYSLRFPQGIKIEKIR